MDASGDKEIDVLGILGLVLRFKKWVLGASLLLTAVGGTALFLIPDKYQSEAVFMVTTKDKSNPLEQWSVLAEQFGFKMSQSSDPLLSILDRVLKSDGFYRDFRTLSVNPEFPADSSLVRLLKVENVPSEKQAKALAGAIVKRMKFVTNKDNSYSIIVKTEIPSLSRFLADRIASQLNAFFLARANAEMGRKISFLTGELQQNRRELDSLSGRLRSFLDANKDFTSPSLNFKYRELNQELTVATEKYMLTMKAQQSLKIAASQPDYFFESVTKAEEAGPASVKQKLKLIIGIFIASVFASAIGVLFFTWFLNIVRPVRTAP